MIFRRSQMLKEIDTEISVSCPVNGAYREQKHIRPYIVFLITIVQSPAV